MLWGKWSLWNFILKQLAQAQGFLDPTVVFARLQKFSQPSEVWVPTELLRSGAVLQARGLINSQAIQHNLDWIWPFWVEKQFNPRDEAFIPRAFNMTHINLTCRNWTALGLPDFSDFPLVDPRGLVTPLFDGWSMDGWIVTEKYSLIPSRLPNVQQKINFNDSLKVVTFSKANKLFLESQAQVNVEEGIPICETVFKAFSPIKAWLVVALRPYNPEGISSINEIKQFLDKPGWEVNHRDQVSLSEKPAHYYFSNYESGDIYDQLVNSVGVNSAAENKEAISCTIGMASSAAVYALEPNEEREITVKIPLAKTKLTEITSWPQALGTYCRLSVPDKKFQFLYDMALRTLVLHSPGEVYPGPFTYKRFWFRDAAFILDALIAAGLLKNIEKILDTFPHRQTPLGYFESQDGEWDSNGQALWIMNRFVSMTKTPIKKEWLTSVDKAAQWIQRKRLPSNTKGIHAGLLPAGFSAEHFGPSDFYYWDDFWAVAGLRSAAALVKEESPSLSQRFATEADDLLAAIDRSLSLVQKKLNHQAVPSSPYRRMDSGAIGSLIASYPLQLWSATDSRILKTAEYLVRKYLLEGAFYHEICHSGINAYLSLHLAQTLLRAGDPMFFDIVKAVAELASPTGQWPEAIHPRTKGGCMGDGQHVWAAAEWVLMIRNMFVREEQATNTLILCSGIPEEWLQDQEVLSLGPTITTFGEISVSVKVEEENIHVSWEANWQGTPPLMEIHLTGYGKKRVAGDKSSMTFLSRVSATTKGAWND